MININYLNKLHAEKIGTPDESEFKEFYDDVLKLIDENLKIDK